MTGPWRGMTTNIDDIKPIGGLNYKCALCKKLRGGRRYVVWGGHEIHQFCVDCWPLFGEGIKPPNKGIIKKDGRILGPKKNLPKDWRDRTLRGAADKGGNEIHVGCSVV